MEENLPAALEGGERIWVGGVGGSGPEPETGGEESIRGAYM